ncbi:MAG: hypothetical protein FWH18_12215 [Marinilabiliaceae bacterium]|nr:hypothetical protein [Marinilabiliaceae bacterium]
MRRLIETIKISLATTLVAGLFFLFLSCKDDSGVDTGTNNNGDGGLTITAEVEDGNEYNNLVDKVRAIMYRGGETIIIAECGFKDGGFDLKLPKEVNNNQLYELDNFIGAEIWDYHTISDPDVLLNEIILIAIKNGENVGIFSFYNETSTTHAHSTYWYVDADVTIKPTSAEIHEGADFNIALDLPLKKGWNELFYVASETSSGLFHTFSLNEPSGLKWQLDFTGGGDPDDPGIGTDNTITAKVEDGNEYNGWIDEVWGLVLSSYDYYEAANTKYRNGGFTIQLPSTVNGNYLSSIVELFEDEAEYYDNFTISDYSASFGIIYFVAVDDYGDYVGEFWHGKYEEKETSTTYSEIEVSGFYLYVNKDVTIKGSYSETYEGDKWDETINLSLKRGWNSLFVAYEYLGNYNTGNATGKWSVTHNNPGGLKWYFEDWNGYKSTITKSAEKRFPFEKVKSTSKLISKFRTESLR